MSSVLGGAVSAVADAAKGAIHMAQNTKISEMEKDMVDTSKQTGMTTNHGIAVSNTDIWLSATTSDRQGPQLLEDEWAREKVSSVGQLSSFKH